MLEFLEHVAVDAPAMGHKLLLPPGTVLEERALHNACLVLDVLEMEAAMSDAYIFLVAVVSRGIARWHVLMLGSFVEAAGRLARTTFHRFLPHSRLLCHYYDYD